MRKYAVALLICTIGTLVTSSHSTAFDESANVNDKAVRMAAAEFYRALNAMFTGDVGPMKEVWSHADDVTYMGPAGGIHVGWDQVLADWEAQAALKLGGEVHPEELHINAGRDLAIVTNYEIGKNLNADGQTQNVKIRATNTFRNEGGKWKMIGHHTDLLPFLQQ